MVFVCFFFVCFCLLFFFFFFNDTATTEIYTLSLHDALPIYVCMVLKTKNRTRNHIFGSDFIPRCPLCVLKEEPPLCSLNRRTQIRCQMCGLWSVLFGPSAFLSSPCWPSAQVKDNSRWNRQLFVWGPETLASLLKPSEAFGIFKNKKTYKLNLQYLKTF